MTHEAPTTPEAKIAYLAEKVMGWVNWSDSDYWFEKHEPIVVARRRSISTEKAWNPLKSWDDWRQVEEKLMEDESLWSKYIWALEGGYMSAMATRSTWHYCKSDLPTRVDALIAAHKSLNA